MTAARTANVAEEGVQKVVRFSGRVSLPTGPVAVREIAETGEVVLTPISRPAETAESWDAFLDHLASTPGESATYRSKTLLR